MQTTTTRFYQLTATEFDWKISDQITIKVWGFNQSFPGPVLKARRGDTMVIKVKNDLQEATTIHWHGIRLSASMDGTDDVQKPIQPGEEFEYRFIVPDTGTFWYHSHFNETRQMERGMYGALIVEDDTEPVFDADKVLMMDDIKLTADNEFRKGNFIERWMERHDGRQGDIVLLNGKEEPEININAGQTERWRFINSSSARYIRLYLGGKDFKIIGTDGGLLEHPEEVTEVLIIPGERMDIAAGPFTEGENFLIESLAYNRTTFLKTKDRNIATVKVGATKPSIARLPYNLREIEPLAPQGAEITRKVKFSVGASWKHGIDFLVNGQLHNVDKQVNVGELQVWEVSNTSLMDHPFHLHGFFFQVIEENGKAPVYKAWKDSYNLKPKSKIKIAWMPDNRPGMWMYHCHILEHHEAGMMGHFEVVNPEKGPSGVHHHHHAHHHTP
ncbi:multicopper oxidase family protein [Niastella caeni]|uniref:Multicopper oxidase family protein n=1 Tax=Niastella caeni TaxID=2569763 RepID=A0A4V4GZB2_9BACT|nr:multicopper oxidase family protein [Niastella caeni]THU32036.1 multicopper oxidase family protein [Niastella caeni]